MANRRLLPALRQAVGLERKALSTGNYGGLMPGTSATYGFQDRAAGWDLDAVVADGYERVVWVFKAVELIAGNASRLPFKITSGENEEVETHPLLRVMNKRANPLETGRSFRKRLSAQVLLSKRGAFVEVTKSRAGQVVRLDLLPPDRVRIVPDLSGDYIDYFEFTRHDGVVRNLPPERVRWIREPHPVDPFSGITPLEAAGMSVELDHLARVYNVSFINKDGRPGGILGVDADGLEDDELDLITRKLAPGPHHAGQITALGTGPGGLNYIDTSARPRDMAYETTSEKAKKEILAAFGVPESLAGNASERTFDNASQEGFNFWQDPMLPHLDLIASAFDGDVDEDLDCIHDTSNVLALEWPARQRREEARKEWNDGLRNIKEYRQVAELEEIDNPHTRALWISPAKAPVPTQAGDEGPLGLGDPNATGGGDPFAAGGPPAEGAPGEVEAGGTAQEAVAAAIEDGASPEEATAVALEAGPAAAALEQARGETGEDAMNVSGEATAAVQAARMEGKALSPAVEGHQGEDPPPVQEFDPGDEELRRVELAVAAALDALLARQAGVVAARIESPKNRRGTRYWTPDGDADKRVGDAPIDSERVIDQARWSAETQETLRPLAEPAAQSSAEELLAAMAATGAVVAPAAAGAVVAGRATEAAVESAETIAKAASMVAASPALLAVAVAQAAMEEWLSDRIVELDRLMVEQDPSLAELVEAVKKMWGEKSRAMVDSLAVTVAQTAVAGGRDAAVDALVPQPSAEAIPVVERVWRTREDERVRAAHEEAAGQVRYLGESFEVGGHPMRYPSDPMAPPSVARNCRCWLLYRWAPDAQFTLGNAAA